MTVEDDVRTWLDAVRRELGLDGSMDNARGLDAADELVGTVTDRVGAQAGARTAFLIGAAAASAEEPPVAAQDHTEKIAALARSWNADTKRSEPPNDQASPATTREST